MKNKKDCGLLIKQICTHMTKINNNYLRDKDLTTSQIRYLNYLYSRQGTKVPMKEFEAVFEVAQPTVAGIMRRLEDKGLIMTERNDEDRRSKFISLTDKGLGLMNDHLANYDKLQESLTDNLTTAEKNELFRLLTAVLANVS